MTKKQWVLKAAIFSALRRLFKRTPMFSECLKKAKQEVFIKGKTKDKIRRVQYKCAHCKKLFNQKSVQVDHTDPVVPVEGLPERNGEPDFLIYIQRLFCPISNLQVLCKKCHKIKSLAENKERRLIKKEDKQNGKPTTSKVTNHRRREQSTTKKRSN